MKKKNLFILITCIIIVLLAGCGGKEEKKKEDNEKKLENIEVTVYEQLDVKEEALPDEEVSGVERGIEEWASSFLVIDSDEKDKDVLDKALYSSISKKDQRNALKKKRTEFYKDSKVEVAEVKSAVKKSNQAVYSGRNVGIIECEIVAKGKRNTKDFMEQYHVKLVVDYIGEVVSVYEVEDISW